MTVTVLRCIGCGAIETSQPCLGTCVDRRLDLVDGAQHAAAVAALSALEAAVAERRTLLARLTRAAEWEALRAGARAALRVDVEVIAGDVMTTWACESCGRIEAPQPCIGVCVRPETTMVPADEHAAIVDAARAAQRELERLGCGGAPARVVDATARSRGRDRGRAARRRDGGAQLTWITRSAV